ncbi:MAG: aldehyde dehydrogenase family protein [Chitinivibrionales bacterium]|nr:aldehyde dehydrogenase family protein [Chitinivibrionales bacterium]
MQKPAESIYGQSENGIHTCRNFIHGEWAFPENAEFFRIYNPANGELIAKAPLCTKEHISKVVESAKSSGEADAFSPQQRLKVMESAARILEENANLIATTITQESGKPISAARKEVASTVERLELAREEARAVYGEYIPGEWAPDTHGKFAIVLRNPVGVAATLSSFNYPLFIGAAKIIPALVAGNSVVAKPASDTPISILMFASVLEKAGLPSGTLQVVTGKGSVIGSALAKSPHIAAISFTGSTAAGKAIASKAGLKKLHLELGGKAAALVLPDADIGQAAQEICKGVFKNSGQRCDAISRVLAHKDIKQQLIDAVAEESGNYTLGDPMDENVRMGPLINEDAKTKVEQLVSDAVDSGAQIVTGGRADGLFYPPTIIDNVEPAMNISCDEIFGPVMPIIQYDNIEEAIEISNASEFGLDSCLFTRDISLAIKTARQLQDGSVSINTAPAHGVGHFPFGGNKNSGIGREGLKYSIDELTRLHTIVIKE